MSQIIEVYADMAGDGWMGEAILRIGPRKVVLYQTEQHYPQAHEAESAAADRVIERLGRLMTDPIAPHPDEAKPAVRKRLAAAAQE